MFWPIFLTVISQTAMAQDPGLLERKSLYGTHEKPFILFTILCQPTEMVNHLDFQD